MVSNLCGCTKLSEKKKYRVSDRKLLPLKADKRRVCLRQKERYIDPNTDKTRASEETVS
jgi:hypothetical protein